VEDHDDPLVRLEKIQQPERLVPIENLAERIAGVGESVGSIERDETDPTPAAESIAAEVDEDPVEPWTEAVCVPEQTDRSPRPDQCVLGHVLGLVRITASRARTVAARRPSTEAAEAS
jgi:hypothetical protein